MDEDLRLGGGLPTDGKAEQRMNTFDARGFKNGHHLWRVAVVGQGRPSLLVIRSSALLSVGSGCQHFAFYNFHFSSIIT